MDEALTYIMATAADGFFDAELPSLEGLFQTAVQVERLGDQRVPVGYRIREQGFGAVD